MFETGNDEAEASGPDRAAAHRWLDKILDAAPNDPGASLGEAIEAHAQLSNLTDGRLVAILPGWEQSGDWTHDGSPTPAGWLVNHTGMARRTAGALRKTATLSADIPAVASAATAGMLPRSHVALLVRARTPDVADIYDQDIPRLVHQAQTLTVDGLKILLARWRIAALEALGRNEADRDPDPHGDRDTLSIATTFGGRTMLRGEYGAVSAATLVESIDAELDTWYRNGLLDGDTRTRDQLRAAAHLAIIQRGARPNTSHGGPRPLIHTHIALTDLLDRTNITNTDDRLARRADILNGGPVAAATVRDLLCDADLTVTITDNNHQPLYTGRTHRTTTPAQHRALVLRAEGTCETTGCDHPHHWCHAHHIHWWEHGGTTDINNLTLVCAYHHQAIHQGLLHVTQTPNGPHFTTPDGQPLTYPYRNTA